MKTSIIQSKLEKRPLSFLIWTGFFCITVVIGWCSLAIGAKSMEWDTVFQVALHYDATNTDHQVIVYKRLPRLLGAVLIGASLAVSGALMQGVTRNYLASPSIMGVTDGSLLMVTSVMVLFSGVSSLIMIGSSIIGSAIASLIVFGIAASLPQGFSPVRLAILGTIIGTFFGSVAQAMALYFQVSQDVGFWYSARLHQIDLTLIVSVTPIILVGIIFAMCLSRQITTLALGDEMSTGLGQRTGLVKGLAFLAVVVLTGIAVALAGRIAFVGLAVPHITRFIVGHDYKKIIPFSAIIGGVFLAFSDVISRILNFPFETPVGVVTAVFGVPFLLYLIKTRGGKRIAKTS